MKAISALALAMTIFAAVASGQQAAAPAVSVAASTCMETQRRSLGLLEAIDRRVETARQSNSPAELRAAVADVQRGLLEVRTELSRCTAQPLAPAVAGPKAPAAADPHADHATPGK